MLPLLFLRDTYFMSKKKNIKKLILKSQYISEDFLETEDNKFQDWEWGSPSLMANPRVFVGESGQGYVGPLKVESEFLTSYFKKASTAYSEEDISELFTIASVLDIDTSDLDPINIIGELENSIQSKQLQTLAMKSSLAWKWAMASTDKEKDDLRKFIIQYIEDNY